MRRFYQAILSLVKPSKLRSFWKAPLLLLLGFAFNACVYVEPVAGYSTYQQPAYKTSRVAYINDGYGDDYRPSSSFVQQRVIRHPAYYGHHYSPFPGFRPSIGVEKLIYDSRRHRSYRHAHYHRPSHYKYGSRYRDKYHRDWDRKDWKRYHDRDCDSRKSRSDRDKDRKKRDRDRRRDRD